MKTSRTTSHRYRLLALFLLLITGVGPVFVKQARAQDTSWVLTKVSPQLEIWFRDWTGDRAQAASVIERNFETLKNHPLYKERLPKALAVLVDGQWTKTAGYWASTLRAPSGRVAVLLSPRVSVETILQPDENLKVLAHELTHLVHYGLRPTEQSWVREGLGLLAEYIVTRSFNSSLIEGYAEPETSLVSDLDPAHADRVDVGERASQYGHLLQYFYYLYRVCGKEQLFGALLSSPSQHNGPEFIDEVLRAGALPNPACAGFRQSFEYFETARFKNDPSRPENYVLLTSLEPTVRASGAFLLPPFSAGVYQLGGRKACVAGELSLSVGRCLRIRAE